MKYNAACHACVAAKTDELKIRKNGPNHSTMVKRSRVRIPVPPNVLGSDGIITKVDDLEWP